MKIYSRALAHANRRKLPIVTIFSCCNTCGTVGDLVLGSASPCVQLFLNMTANPIIKSVYPANQRKATVGPCVCLLILVLSGR